MRKQNKINMLTYLYMRLAINKLSIISISISYLILLAYLLFITYFDYSEKAYISMYEDIHSLYLRNSSFISMILNSIILIVLIMTIFVDSVGFDSIHVPVAKRGTIFISKLLSILILIFIISIISFGIIIILAKIFYSNFMLSKAHLSIFFYFIISMVIQLGITLLILSFINNLFIPITGFFITFIMLFIGSNYEKIDGISYIIPIFDQDNNLKNIPVIGLSIAILSMFIYSLIYDTKNIN